MNRNESIERYRMMPLKLVKSMLGYEGRGFRSVIAWCKKKGIQVIGTGQRSRILESDWMACQLKELIFSIQQSHPNTWKQVLDERGITWERKEEVQVTGKYQPKSKVARRKGRDRI